MLAASLDQVSGHVLAAAIVRAAAERGCRLTQPVNVTEVAGEGIAGMVGGREVRLGRAEWAGARETGPWVRAARRRSRLDGALTFFIAIDGQPAGVLLVEDRLRPDARQTIRSLRRGGIGRIVLPAVWGALLQEAIDVAVILNALRALAPAPPAIRMTAADTDLTRRFRAEHEAILADVEQLRSAAQTLGQPGAMDRVRRVHERLICEVWPHEDAEESDLYPVLDRILGGTEPTARTAARSG